MEAITMPDGRTLRVHSADECHPPNCCIHDPSDHPLRDAPLEWRDDTSAMVRVCPHDGRHPDPDDLANKARVLGPWLTWFHDWWTHECDGCCGGIARPATPAPLPEVL